MSLDNCKNILLDLFIKFKNEIIIMIMAFGTFLTPIHGLFYLVGSVVMLDTFLGVYASVKIKGLKSINSHSLFNLVVKTFFYMGTILIAFLISKFIFDGSLFGVPYLTPKFLCGIWILIEIKSIDETSIKLGNKPMLQIINGFLNKAKKFKKDLNELKD